MGGGGSKPAQAQAQAPATGSSSSAIGCPGGVKRETVRPQPTPKPGSEGLSRAVVESNNRVCLDCNLKIPANASSSSATLTRKTGEGNFSELTKVFIKPSLPFSVNYRGREYAINTLTVYYPFPLRIENVQYDAALSLGDASENSDIVILIPLAASNQRNPGTEFLDRITPFIRSTLGATAVSRTQVVDTTGGSQQIPVENDRCTGGGTSYLSVNAVADSLEKAKRDKAARKDYFKLRLDWYLDKGYSEADIKEYDKVRFDWDKGIRPSGGTGVVNKGAFKGQSRYAVSEQYEKSPEGQAVLKRVDDQANFRIKNLEEALQKAKDSATVAEQQQLEDRIQREIAKTQLVGCNDTSVQTGADWNLTKIIPVDGNSLAEGSFYTWQLPKYEQFVESDTRCERILGWKAVENGRRYIVITDPALISAAAMTSIRTLPYTKPEDAFEGIGEYVYKKGVCKGCKPAIVNANLAEQQAIENAKGVSRRDLVEILLWLMGSLLIVAGVYLAVKWTFTDTATQLPPLGDKLGILLKSITDAIGRFFSNIGSLVAMGAKAASPAGKAGLAAEVLQSATSGKAGIAAQLLKAVPAAK